MTTPQIIAHRGASYLAPENTLVAFRKAMEIGADGVEMDVQKTYDNELVIHHDYMVDMHTDISGQIYDLTMGELKALDFGSWKDAIYANERIATLQEALELCAGMEGTQVQLELKSPLEDDPDFVPRVLDAVRAAGLTDRLTLISFHHSQLRQAKQLMCADLRRFPQHGAASAGGVEGSGSCEQHGRALQRGKLHRPAE